jgi:DNA repair photolyase
MPDPIVENKILDSSDQATTKNEVEIIIKAAFQELADHINKSYREIREEIWALYPDAFPQHRDSISKK